MPNWKITINNPANLVVPYWVVTVYKEKNTAKGAFDYAIELGNEIMGSQGPNCNYVVEEMLPTV